MRLRCTSYERLARTDPDHSATRPAEEEHDLAGDVVAARRGPSIHEIVADRTTATGAHRSKHAILRARARRVVARWSSVGHGVERPAEQLDVDPEPAQHLPGD